MSESTERLRHLLADELGAGTDDDVAERLHELDALADEAVVHDDARARFELLGDETRYALARALVADGSERCVCELGALVDVSESTVGRAARELADAGLLDRRKDGNWRYYQATPLAERLLAAAESVAHDA